MIKTFCDRCGKEESTKQTIVQLSHRDNRKDENVLWLDLCTECDVSFQAFVRSFPTQHKHYTTQYRGA